MTLQARVQALLDLVEGDRACRCDAIARETQARVAATLGSARAESLERIRSAFSEERDRREARIAAAQATLQTHRRLHDQRRAAALLAAGWQKLPDALCERWRQAQSRRAWVDRVVTEARAALPRSPWNVAYAPGWPEDERDALSAALEQELGAAPQLRADADLRAGLKVAAGGNVIDGTLSGLLADRAEIGALLLRHLESGP